MMVTCRNEPRGVHDGALSPVQSVTPPTGRISTSSILSSVRTVAFGIVDDTSYDNTCARANVGFNITDGHRVALRVCLRDGALGPITYCSAWKETTA